MSHIDTMPNFPVIIVSSKKGTFPDILIYTLEAWARCCFATGYLCHSLSISQCSQLSIIFAGFPSSSCSLAATLVRRHPERKLAQHWSDSCLSLCPGVCHATQSHTETFSVDVTDCKLLFSFLYAIPAKCFLAFGSPSPTEGLNFGLLLS